GKRGYTYTHHTVLGDSAVAKHNRAVIAEANANGFTINLSANSTSEVPALLALGIAPVVCVLPAEMEGKRTQYLNRLDDGLVGVVTCPATYDDNVQCASCKVCAVAKRPAVIAFPAHGASKQRASQIARR